MQEPVRYSGEDILSLNLKSRPALVLSTLSLKQRKRNQFDFVRFAEEQFVDDWFDVLLARSNESKIDQIPELDRFGALIVEDYDYANEDAAFEKLLSLGRTRPLMLFSANNPLILRIRIALAEFRHAVIIERSPAKPDEWLVAEGPSLRYKRKFDSKAVARDTACARGREDPHGFLDRVDLRGQAKSNRIKCSPNIWVMASPF